MESQIVSKARINSLTATRGIAALAVVIVHFGCEVFPFSKFEHFFRAGNLAVSYFFVLSGFVMSWTYMDKSIGYGEFLKRRAVRIFPFYYFALALSMLLPLYYFLTSNTAPEESFLLKLALNLTFTQAYFPGYELAINPPGWSLSVEMFFYLLFPILLKFQQKKELVFSWVVVAFFVVSQVFHFWQLHVIASSQATQYTFAYYFPLFHLNEFLVGMLSATLLPRAIRAGIRLPVLVIAIVIALVMNYRVSGISLHNGMMAPLFLLLILGLAIKDKGWMKSRVLVFAGDMSYGVYILQFPVHSLFRYFNDLYFHLANTTFFYVYLVTLFLVTVIAHYTVEKPLRNVLLKRG